jgi:hypothetical protein
MGAIVPNVPCLDGSELRKSIRAIPPLVPVLSTIDFEQTLVM